MMKNRCRWLQFMVPLVFFALTWNISFHTPMHSDDFGTFLAGFPNLEMHWHRYCSWSGRVVADIISATIIGINNHVVISFISALATISYIAIATAFILSVSKLKKSNFWLLFIFLFLSYWLGNPNLGQTTFWIVGSANYLWTNLFVLLFFLLVFAFKKNGSIISCTSCFVMGVLAGCSNENMGLAVIFICIIMLAKHFWEYRNINTVVFLGTLGVVLGAAILLMAPGNSVRLHVDGDAWLHFSLYEKIKIGVKSVANAYWHNKIVILIMASVGLVLLVASPRQRIKEIYNKDKDTFFYFVLFALAAAVANVVMIASPGYPPRAMNGQFTLHLCSFGFLLALAIKSNKDKYLYFFSIMLILPFTVSYLMMNESYRCVYAQAKTRTALIQKQRDAGMKNVEIPDYYFKPLLREGDKFDMFKADPMARYFNVDKIAYTFPNFDYSVAFEVKGNVDNVGKLKKKTESIAGIYGYTELFGIYSVLVLQVPDEFVEHAMSHEAVLDIVYLNQQEKNIVFSPEFTKIDNKWFTYIRKRGLQIDSIDELALKIVNEAQQ